MPPPALLQLQSVSKRFGSVTALHNLSVLLATGGIYGLAGENGAGKSTLIKILAGVHQLDSGEIHFDGRSYAPRSTTDSVRAGISVFHQEIPVCPDLSVAANVYLADHSQESSLDHHREMEEQCRQLLIDLLGIELDPGQPMGMCTAAERQLALLGSCPFPGGPFDPAG